MGKILGIFGTGGLGRELLPEISKIFVDNKEFYPSDFENIVYIEDKPKHKIINSTPIMSTENFLNINSNNKFFVTAIGNLFEREKISDILIKNGASPVTIMQNNSVIYATSFIGDGSIVSSFSTITANSRIGKFSLLNIFSLVAHDCEIGNYVTFGPRVSCLGNVIIRDRVLIGAGATIKQGSYSDPIVIGSNSVIGMGSVVTKSLPDNVLAYGVPAKIIKKFNL